MSKKDEMIKENEEEVVNNPVEAGGEENSSPVTDGENNEGAIAPEGGEENTTPINDGENNEEAKTPEDAGDNPVPNPDDEGEKQETPSAEDEKKETPKKTNKATKPAEIIPKELKKGLKKGDIFKDGKYTYQVVKVNENGSYVSKRLERA